MQSQSAEPISLSPSPSPPTLTTHQSAGGPHSTNQDAIKLHRRLTAKLEAEEAEAHILEQLLGGDQHHSHPPSHHHLNNNNNNSNQQQNHQRHQNHSANASMQSTSTQPNPSQN